MNTTPAVQMEFDIEKYCICEHCSNVSLRSQGEKVHDEFWCESCIEKFCDLCDRCHSSFPEGELTCVQVQSGNERHWCESCIGDHAWICDSCGNFFSQRIRATEYNDHWWCPDCADDLVSCESCGEIMHVDNSYSHRDRLLCESCYSDSCSDSIHEYGYSPCLDFYGIEGETRGITEYYGMECEVESDSWSADDIADHVDSPMLYCTRDGSLEDGVEVKNMPCTLAYMRKNGLPHDPLFRIANRSSAARVTKTCGFHIHTSRHAWTSLQLYKAQLLLAQDIAFTEHLACREHNGYWPITYDKRSMVQNINGRTGTRYAVNIGSNTVEFRLFAGTVDPSRVWQYLETILAIRAYVSLVIMREVSVQGFVDYVLRKPDQFPHLADHLSVKIC